jgi:hypothetical protein
VRSWALVALRVLGCKILILGNPLGCNVFICESVVVVN